MDLKMTARLAAVTALALAVAVTIVARHKESFHDKPTLRHVGPDDGPLSRELARCRKLGEAAVGNAACKAAWEENRRRFFMPAERDRPAWPADDRFGNIERSIGEPAAP